MSRPKGHDHSEVAKKWQYIVGKQSSGGKQKAKEGEVNQKPSGCKQEAKEG